MKNQVTCLGLLVLGLCNAVIIASSYSHYRLPTAIYPYLYELKVITHLENPANLTFYGDVTITFTSSEDTTNITLHSQDLTIDESQIIVIDYDGGKKLDCVLSVTHVPEQDYLIIQLCETIRKRHRHKLKLSFSSVLSEKLYGYYVSSYDVEGSNEPRLLSVTQFEPAHARAAFPCFDEPEYKAKFVVWLGHHKSLTALSNMPLEKQVPLTGIKDFVWSIFKESVPMSTYLVAYTINDFAFKKSKPNSQSNNDVLFRTWAKPESIDQVDFASEVGPKVLKYYEDIFRIRFPLRKVDQIAIPDFSAGAMENWGLITYRETDLLFAPNVSSNSYKLRIAQVIAHELAHQWFGNLVTMKWWSDLWLNEGFATYVASLGVEYLYPEWESYNEESLENALEIFRRDAQLSSHPISQPILSTEQISERFDTISYKKGSAVLRMLHLVLEDKAFFEGVCDYLQRHMFANAEQDDLWAAFTKKAHYYNRLNLNYEMKTIMDSWTLQTGYPLVTVERDYETGSVEISQYRFLENKTLTEQQTDKANCWWVPLSYTTEYEMNFKTTTPYNWLECDKSGRGKILRLKNLAKRDEWIVFNIQLSGVYRVMYDAENWRLLNKTLNSKQCTKIHVMNRAQIIDDAIWLAWSGYQEYDITFDILEYLIHEREYLPWRAALDGLNGVNRLLRPFQVHYELFKRYMRNIITPVYFYLGGINVTLEDSSSFTKSLHQSLIVGWACRLDMRDCVQKCINYFNQWKSSRDPNTDNIIPADLRSTVYCTAIRNGNDEDWQFLWQRYKESKVASERRTIIFALSCSRNPKTLSNYVKMAYEKGGSIREQDSMFVFGNVARTEVGFPIAKQYFMENIDQLNEFYGPHSNTLAYLLSPLASQISTTEDSNKLKRLIESKKDLFKKTETSVRSAFETIGFNIQWIDRNAQNINTRLQLRLRYVDEAA